MRKLWAVVVILICSLPGIAQTSSADLQSELEALHGKWFTAFDSGDGATMDKIEVSNLILVLPNGEIWAKSGPRAGSQPRGDVAAQRSLSNVAIRQFGDIAILTGVITTTATKKEDNGKAATTVVFVRSSGSWKITSAQWTPVLSSK